MDSYKRLLLANKAWRAEIVENYENFFEELDIKNSPEFLWIGCSDARVPAETVTGAIPGEIYVHRNVANLIYDADTNVMSVLDYSINELKVKTIIVCGHHGCGGVKAALDETSSRSKALDSWVECIKSYAPEGATGSDGELVDSISEKNVVAQVHNLAKMPMVRRWWSQDNSRTIHGWIFNVRTGLIEPKIMLDHTAP